MARSPRPQSRDDEERFATLRERYLDFAEHEAKGASPLYEELSRAAAESEPLLRFIASLPEPKQQPNLVFAAVRHLYGTPRDRWHFAQLVRDHGGPLRTLILRRSTQTNEPGRCATLLPALARLPQPLALLEVGASAGLCLLLDHYAYDFGGTRLEPRRPGALPAPVFPCRANAATPSPDQIPTVVWRAGLDLNPLDASHPEDAAWLESLVWPGQEARAERVRAALRIAREHPVRLVKGDLLSDLGALAATAPQNATLVIFHSAVLAYVTEERQETFARAVMEIAVTWISNESPGVLPWIAGKLPEKPPEDRFLLSVNGEPVALTGPHGQLIEWFS